MIVSVFLHKVYVNRKYGKSMHVQQSQLYKMPLPLWIDVL